MDDIATQNLRSDRDSAKQEVARLERAFDMGELERLKLEDKLQRSQRKCRDLEKTVARLLEEKRGSNDRGKRAEDLSEKISAENSKISYENQNLILALNEKTSEAKHEKSENERLAGICQEQFKCFDAMVEKLGGIITGLRQENSAATQTVEELKLENTELRRKKSETDAAAQMYKSSLETLSDRMKQIEEDLTGVLSMKVGDLATFANEVSQLASPEHFADSKGEDDDSSGSAENGIALSPGVSSPPSDSAVGSANSGLSKKGDRDDGANTFEESNECEEPLESGEHSSGTQLMCGEGCFSKNARSSFVAGDIIDIHGSSSDDEVNPDGPDYISNKRNRTECMGDILPNSTTKRRRNMPTCDEDGSMST